MIGDIQRHPCQPRPWRVRYRDHDGTERTRAFTRRRDAERFLAQVTAAASHRDRVAGRVG